MANSDKNIVITPNIGQSADPSLSFTGQGNIPISLKVLDDSFGTLSFQNSSGVQLFSINNSTTGSIFSINDLSGLPVFEVDSDGHVDLAPHGGSVRVYGHNYIESANLTMLESQWTEFRDNNNGYIRFNIYDPNLHYITNTDVMEINNSGEYGLLIKKRGILHCFVSHDVISGGSSSYMTLRFRVNGSNRGSHLITNTNGQWDGFVASQALKVNAGDVVSLYYTASDIINMDRNTWGVYSFLFHAV